MRSFLTHGGCAVLLMLVTAGLFPESGVQAEANLLRNPGFEEGFSLQAGVQEVSVPIGWTAWWVQGSTQETDQGYLVRPEYKGEDSQVFGNRRVHGGRFSAKHFSSYSTHDAGYWQTVNVPAGATLQFGGWVQTWSSSGDDPGQVVTPGYYQVRLGIDPTGGIDPLSESVVWSEPAYADNVWVQLLVNVRSIGSWVTVFARGTPTYRVKHNDSYWDDLSLVQTSGAAFAPTASPTLAPAVSPPDPGTGAIHVVAPGETLYRISLRYNTSVAELVQLNQLADPALIRVGQQLLVQVGTGSTASSPASTPNPAGAYQVQAGDSLASIARRFNTTVNALVVANNIVNPNLVYQGQTLVVVGTPSAGASVRVHVVQPGDTLTAIASRYGMTYWALAHANDLASPHLIWAGQQLVIPGQ
jgi:LysM repeat protein